MYHIPQLSKISSIIVHSVIKSKIFQTFVVYFKSTMRHWSQVDSDQTWVLSP